MWSTSNAGLIGNRGGLDSYHLGNCTPFRRYATPTNLQYISANQPFYLSRYAFCVTSYPQELPSQALGFLALVGVGITQCISTRESTAVPKRFSIPRTQFSAKSSSRRCFPYQLGRRLRIGGYIPGTHPSETPVRLWLSRFADKLAGLRVVE
jgi:hypothetical protein